MSDHIADADKKVQPAPAPLPEEVEGAVARLKVSVKNVVMGGWKQAMPDLDIILRHFSDLTRRLAEAEVRKAELSNTVEMVKRGLNGPWEPGGDVAVLAKEAGDALQSIGRLRAVGDWDWYRELPAKVEAIQVRAEAAEARVRELEAFKARVMAWARGRCECCKNNNPENGACPDDCYPGHITAWTPPQAWEPFIKEKLYVSSII